MKKKKDLSIQTILRINCPFWQNSTFYFFIYLFGTKRAHRGKTDVYENIAKLFNMLEQGHLFNINNVIMSQGNN